MAHTADLFHDNFDLFLLLGAVIICALIFFFA